jgi:hypothetical protein
VNIEDKATAKPVWLVSLAIFRAGIHLFLFNHTTADSYQKPLRINP